MDRRRFLKIAGLTFGSIFISDTTFSSVLGNPTIPMAYLHLPDFVKIVTDDQSGIFIVGSKNNYIDGDIQVRVFQHNGELIFKLNSPTKHVKYVIVGWKTTRPVTSLCLGDHWERGYGDLQWMQINKDRIMPWYFMEYNGTTCNGFGVKTGPNTLCHWKASTTELQLVMDVRNGSHGVDLGSRELKMATAIVYKGKEGERPFVSLRRFCKMMCQSPRLADQPVYGINDWYFAYGNNSDKLIMQTVDMMVDLAQNTANRPFCLIDAGWAVVAPGKANASNWSDNFYTPGVHFKDMGDTAFRIKAKGMRPGLWMRPLCAAHNTPPSFLLPHSGHSLNPGEELLDPTISENVEYINKCFHTYQDWGYEMVKHDFSTFDLLGRWGFEMIAQRNVTGGDWTFYNQTKTNAEVILDLYRSIRQAAGDIKIIGCNTVSHLAAGLFELQRIGDDTSGHEWARTKKMGVNSIAFRGAQHNTFYGADGDCVGLTTEIDWNLNRQWMELLAGSGTPLFISAQPQAIGIEQKKCIRKCFDLASLSIPIGEPLDWMETLAPSNWILNGEERTFNWH